MAHTHHPVTVRLATAQDEAAIMDLCRLLHHENGAFPLSEERVRGVLQTAFQRQGGIIGVIEGEHGALEACMLLVVHQMWYSDEWCLNEMFSFVRPDCRRNNHARALIEFAKESADKIGVPLLIGIISNQRTEAKVRLYQRQLGAPSGAFFLYGARTGDPAVQH